MRVVQHLTKNIHKKFKKIKIKRTKFHTARAVLVGASLFVARHPYLALFSRKGGFADWFKIW